MFSPVTKKSGPEALAKDKRNKWTKIDEDYYQSNENDGIVLEINLKKSGKYRWWLYDARSDDPETAVIESYDDSEYAEPDPLVADKATIAEAMSAAYAYLDGYQSERN